MLLKSVILLLTINYCILPIWAQTDELEPEEEEFESEDEVIEWLSTEYEELATNNCLRLQTAKWNYETNINAETEEQLAEVTQAVIEDRRKSWEYVSELNITNYTNEALLRQLASLKNIGSLALSDEKLQELTNVEQTLMNGYKTERICPYDNRECDPETEGLYLVPEIEEIMLSSTNYEELTYFWEAWNDARGAKLKDVFDDYVNLYNEAAQLNGFEDAGDMWRSPYEYENFTDILDSFWEEIKPLYDELHTYVRRNLEQRYVDMDASDEMLPANVFGAMSTKSWINLEPSLRPYPSAGLIDITEVMIREEYTAKMIFEKAEELFKSIRVSDSSPSYNDDAMLESPEGRDVICDPSAWDFCDGTYRVKMCANINTEDYSTAHYLLAYIQYYIQYKAKPITFRNAPLPAFYEALGNSIVLSATTPSYLEKMGLLEGYGHSEQAMINHLMKLALDKLPLLAYALATERWRWDVFKGLDQTEWNERWWEYRNTYEKVKAPVDRDNNDFDPGAEFHMTGNEPLINNFMATILGFQLHRRFCIIAGQQNIDNPDLTPLYKCDFSEAWSVGGLFKNGLPEGSSLPWRQVLGKLNQDSEIYTTGIMEYFKPLYEYLLSANGGMSATDLKAFLEGEYAKEAQEVYSAQVHAEWNYATDINEETAQKQIEATLATAAFDKRNWENVFGELHENNFVDEVLHRQVKFLRVLGDAALDEARLSELTSAISSMSTIYNTAKVCPYDNQQCDLDTEGLALNPGIEERISASEDIDELLYLWTAWRSASGANMREDFDTYVKLSNEAAVANGFTDKGEMWRNRFESSTFIEDLDRLWEKVEPLYNELHTYVRRKLRAKYGSALDLSYDLIPAHVLGNMWAQSWVNIASLVKPYPEVTSADITAAMIEKEYDVEKMFEVADDFYVSLGLESCAMSFGNGSMIVRPEGREVNCHASAWDFNDGETFRVKMCTNINYEDFITIHHELGHIEYYLLYKNQPITLRTGANPGFHEAVGDTIALSVATPQHFKTIGLIDDVDRDEEEERKENINSLMDMALERIAFLPFGLLIDKWRWDVFSGAVDSTQWNKRWWHYRETIQKVKSPVARTEDDFDPGAKFHVAADYQYISYFVAHILEFQFFKALCIAAGEYGEGSDKALNECDYYNSTEAGNLLREGLSLGASRHWEDVLEIMTGSREMSADALLEYFNPLYEFLHDANDQEVTQEELEDYFNVDFQFAAVRELGAGRKVDWQFDLNMGTTRAAKLQSVLETAAFRRYWRTFFADIEYTQQDILHQLEELNNLGDAALSNDTLSELTDYLIDWKLRYSGIRVCSYQDKNCVLEEAGLDEEEIQRNMASSEDLDEMLYYWTYWRDLSGILVTKDNYGRYISLANEAAVANSFSNRGDQWRSQYGLSSVNFRSSITSIWDDVEPLYDYLHAFVRRKLKTKYGDALNIADELLPAHVLGSLWGESWWGLAEIMRPNPNNDNINLNAILSDVSIPDIADLADTFFKSMELEGTAAGADALNYFSKPSAQSVCEPTAIDIYGQYHRVKICSTNTRANFKTVHNMLSHVQSFMLYKDQPVVFRNAPTPALYDAVGGAIALSAITPQHLRELELIEEFEESEDSDLNLLMDTALETLPLLPFALVVDNWRWDVFGSLPQSSWNSRWWQYRQVEIEDFQKVKAPIAIQDSDFDAISKYHVLADEQYINKFVSTVLQFQIYKELCIKAEKYNPTTKSPPLHRCSFFGSSAAGAVLKDALSHGSSEDWSEILKTLTDETEVDASAMLEYFEPLQDYLERGSSVMIQFSFILLLTTNYCILPILGQTHEFESEEELIEWLATDYEKFATDSCLRLQTAKWNYETNINTDTAEELAIVTQEVTEQRKQWWELYFSELNIDDYTNEALRRQLTSLKNIGSLVLSDDKLEELTNAEQTLMNGYKTERICPYNNRACDLETEGLYLVPEIEEIMLSSTNYEELTYFWEAWSDARGAKLKDVFDDYVNLYNEAAQLNGFEDAGDMWRSPYEYEDFIQALDNLWEEIKPLYEQLHIFVRRNLEQRYSNMDISDEMLPANVFGAMSTKSWINLEPSLRPYPSAGLIDITKVMIREEYTAKMIFEKAEELFKSIRVSDSSASYNDDAMLESPEGRDVICDPSAWDFCDGTYRVKMCANINTEDYSTAHYLLAYIQYYTQYKAKPITFRNAPLPAFYEALGNSIVLSATTPTYLEKMGLLEGYGHSEQAMINHLMKLALDKLPLLAYALATERWRWDVFKGLDQTEWNERWWEYRNTYEKVKAPVDRDNNDFDPGAEFHTAGNEQLINNFMATILEFQFHRRFCIVAGEYSPNNPDSKPLYKCDFSEAWSVGGLFKNALPEGSSLPWRQVLSKLNQDSEIYTTGIMEYFKPLYEYLLSANGGMSATDLKAFLEGEYAKEAQEVYSAQVHAEWNYETDINEETAQKQIEATLATAAFDKQNWENVFGVLHESHFVDEVLHRQVKFLRVLGDAALDETRLSNLTSAISSMSTIYNTAKVCPYENQECDPDIDGMSLNPGVEERISASEDIDELLYYWTAWRSASGANMREDFDTYVKLSNEAAVANGFTDKGEMWRNRFESSTFIEDLDRLWERVEPLYNELHTYVRRKLRAKYGSALDLSYDLIPAHVLGNMWAQSWVNIASLVKPYPEVSSADITAALIEKGYDVMKMFEVADEFYTSLGLESCARSFGKDSMIVRPEGKEVNCHASAWDFNDGVNFRVKMCTNINYEDFITIHHELGHIEYYLLYKDQPITLRTGANPGFHEAVGDTIALSVATPQHFKTIGLIDDVNQDEEEARKENINSLMDMAWKGLLSFHLDC
ncbi:angiotensin-converting enzyme [Holotrichia oblita]|uniref:Angiotensin-converting enzyme n=1 Tax=Holotrichia oblita TaxID=644536 RepID=A0ACB9SSU8_HOLOL|nr:angiotensin-converting enzyme [Holotrichia oblita]